MKKNNNYLYFALPILTVLFVYILCMTYLHVKGRILDQKYDKSINDAIEEYKKEYPNEPPFN